MILFSCFFLLTYLSELYLLYYFIHDIDQNKWFQ